MELLYDIALKSGNGESFSEDIVSVEKKNIKDAILAQKNDKRSYSVLRLQEEMCKDEPYGINPMGYAEELDKISTDDLYNHYRKILAENNGLYEALCEYYKHLTPIGARIPISKKQEFGFKPEKLGLNVCPWSNCVLERMGIPFYFGAWGEGAVFLHSKGNAGSRGHVVEH